MKKIFLTCLLSTLLCVSAIGQTPTPPTPTPNNAPVVKLVGPTGIKIGNTARFTSNGSSAKNLQWLIFPPDAKDYLTIYELATKDETGTPDYLALFESDKAGKYVITLIGTRGDESSAIQVELINGDGVIPPGPIPPGPGPGPTPTPVVILPDVPVPPQHMQQIVAPIKTKMVGKDVKADSAELANFYNDMADVIARDTAGKIASTGAIRELNINSGTVMFQNTGMKGKYAGLAEAVDTALVQVLTLEDTPLSQTKKNDAVNIFKALAWQFVQIYNQN